MSSRSVQIIINAIDKASPVFSKVGLSAGKLGNSMKGIASAGQLVAGGLAAIGTAAAGSAVVAGLKKATDRFAEVGGALNDMSARTGIGVEALAELQHAAGMTGGSAEAVEGAIKKMQKTIADSAGGSKVATEALARVGVTAADLIRMAPDQQFQKISNAIAGIQDPAQRTAIAMNLFGKSGTMLLPMMQNLRGLREEARSLGVVLTQSQVSAADALGDAMDKAKASIDGVILQIGAQFAPAATSLAEHFAVSMSQVSASIVAVKPAVESLTEMIAREFEATFNAVGSSASVFDIVTTAIGTVIDGIRGILIGFNSVRVAMPRISLLPKAGLPA